MIRINKLFTLLLASALFLSSCDKEEDKMPEPQNPVEQAPEGPEPEPEKKTAGSDCPTGKPGQAVDGQYIVLFKENQISTQSFQTYADKFKFLRDKAEQILQKYGVKSEPGQVYTSAADGFSGKMSREKAMELRNDPDVAFVEQDYFIALDPFTVNNQDNFSQHTPWGIKRIGRGEATNKTAWVLDTGVDLDHPDLNVDQNRSVSFVCTEPTAEDYNGHGTHVAGTIAAIDNEFGVVGVAAGNSVAGVKVMSSDGSGTISSLIAGLDFVYRNCKPGDVVNMSLSGGYVEVLDRFVQKIANEKKVFFALAAGNEAQDAMNLSPQRVDHPYIFTISAMDSTDTYATFSNFGTCVDYCSPGVKIASTYPGGRYAYLSGTSMATPHFAGLLLLNGSDIKSDGVVKNDPDGSSDPIAVFKRPAL